MAHSIITLLSTITQQLEAHYQDPILANQYAWWMLEEVTNRTQLELMLHQDLALTHEQEEKLKHWIHAQVAEHKPLAYLIGWVPFMDFKIKCKPPTLIPRPETEEWSTELINSFPSTLLRTGSSTVRPDVSAEALGEGWKLIEGIRILDLCTGSGCIAIALARAFPHAKVTATDISDDALTLAQENARLNNAHNITFIKSDIYASIPANEKFDLIISNPPYIAPEEWKSLDSSVTRWEDKRALESEDHGLAILKKIIIEAHTRLTENQAAHMPRLVVEIGYQQGPAVQTTMETAGFKSVKIKKDLAGKDRTVWGY